MKYFKDLIVYSSNTKKIGVNGNMKSRHKVLGGIMLISMLLVQPAWAMGTMQTAQVKESEAQVAVAKGQPQFTKEMEKQLDKLYQLVPEVKKLTLKNKEYHKGIENEPDVWFISFEGENKNVTGKQPTYASVEFIAKTGELYSFMIQNPEWASEKLPSQAVAKEKATNWLKYWFGEKVLGQYMLDENVEYVGFGSGSMVNEKTGWTYYGQAKVSFDRIIKGIPLKSHGYQVRVDGEGRLVSFSTPNYIEKVDLSIFPDPSKAISLESANKKYKEYLGNVSLLYASNQPLQRYMFNQSKEKTAPVLKYVSNYSGQIDATTGQLILEKNRTVRENGKIITLTPKGQTTWTVKSREDAEKIIKGAFGVSLVGLTYSDRNVDGDMMLRRDNSEKVWTWSADKKSSAQDKTIHVLFDKNTGKVKKVLVSTDSSKQQKVVEKGEALNTAVEFLNKHISTDVKQVALSFSYGGGTGQNRVQQEYTFVFNKVYQNIPIEDSTYTVFVDPASGKVSGYAIKETDTPVTLPNSKQVITPEDAAEQFFKAHPLQLVYTWKYTDENKTVSPQITYMPVQIDVSGEYVEATKGNYVKLPYELGN